MATATARPRILMQPVKSNAIAAIGYDAASQTLRVRFANSATLHDYSEFPQKKFDDMMRAPSVGGYHATVVRGNFPHTIVADDDHDGAID